MGIAYIVAIAGGTCSGKSTLADFLYENLEKDYNVKLINMDSYMKNPSPKVISPFTNKEYDEHNHPDGIDQEKLYENFNIACDNHSCVIVEGVFALYLKEIFSKADLKVFVDLESDERLVRRIKRFQTYGHTFDEITERYLDTVKFRHNEFVEPTKNRADIIINGNLDRNNGKNILLDYIIRSICVSK